MPNPSMCARGMAAIASTSCAAIMRCGVAPIRGIGKRNQLSLLFRGRFQAQGIAAARQALILPRTSVAPDFLDRAAATTPGKIVMSPAQSSNTVLGRSR